MKKDTSKNISRMRTENILKSLHVNAHIENYFLAGTAIRIHFPNE